MKSWREQLRLILRARRQRLDLSLEAVAAEIGTSKQLLCFWERGSREPRLVEAVRWCKALRIRLGDLLNLICTVDTDFELFDVLEDDIAPEERLPEEALVQFEDRDEREAARQFRATEVTP